METSYILSKIKNNSTVNLIINRLLQNKFDVFVVGGFIRDFLNNKQSKDIDMVTSAKIKDIQEIMKDQKIDLVGKSYLVLIINGIEISTYRKDIYFNNENLKPIETETVNLDASRRDLTINQMYINCKTGDLIDEHGGKKDLENRIIKFIGNPNDRILEDPCRILRACRFIAKINGTFDSATFEALKKHSSYLFNYKIAPERIRLEILKAMKIQKASLFFKALHSIGALNRIFPTLEDCYNHPHGNYHTEDVFEHNMITGDSIYTYDPILKLTGYLHDTGKPSAYSHAHKTFIDHEKLGAEVLGHHLKELTFSIKEIQKICGLIRLHMNSIQNMKPKTIRKLLKKLNDSNINVKDFIRLRMADRKANLNRKNFTLTEWKEMYKILICPKEEDIPFNVNSLAYKGGDIIKDFNIIPGPIVSKIQNYLLDQVLEMGAKFNTKEHLKIFIEEFLGE